MSQGILGRSPRGKYMKTSPAPLAIRRCELGAELGVSLLTRNRIADAKTTATPGVGEDVNQSERVCMFGDT